MHLLDDIDHAAAVALIERITGHLPIGASLGGVYAVGRKGIVAAGGVLYGIDRTDDVAWRMVQLDGLLWESTKWRNGDEICRRLLRAAHPPPDVD